VHQMDEGIKRMRERLSEGEKGTEGG
jgi:hypothetical protein